MRLTSAAVDRYGPLVGCEPPCADGITIVAGPNESGKTLFLEGVLQLLDPDVTDHMEPGPRVASSPTGRVIVDDGTDRHVLGDGITLSGVSQVEPTHLYNVFVIRDSDLALPDGTAYYTSLVEHLGDVHTTEINAIREGLVGEGRLTASRLNLANREYDTKAVAETVESLADDVAAYVETARSQGIDDLARTRLTLRDELRTVEDELAIQRSGAELATIEDATDQLQTYRATTADIQAATVDRATLTRLRELDQELAHARERVAEIDDTLDRKETALERHRTALATARDRHAELGQREHAVADVESTLEAYRDRISGPDVSTDDVRLAQRRAVTASGLAGAGLAGAGSALSGATGARTLSLLLGLGGLVLFLVAAGGWWAHRRLTERAAEAAATERELLRAARDAGFEIDAPEDVPVAIRAYRDELDAAESRVHELDAQVSQTAQRVAELEDALRETTSTCKQLQAEQTATLADARVDSIDAYETWVEELEERKRRRSQAATVLSRELGEPEADEPTARISFWEAALADRRAAVDATADAARYDEAELERLEQRRADLQSTLAELDERLTDHEETLDAFERRASEVSVPPFVETTPSLEARTVAGLADLGADLRAVADEIDRNASISRKAIGILDEIRAAEERKAAALFDPDGPASETFARLTDGRYTAVAYDPDAGSLEVHRSDGGTLTPAQLSQGTRDQLYFAARLSLAEQLLGGEAGFLLLDDPFLAADWTRLRNGFETLQDLAAAGWQILYFTAKREVHDVMAEEFGCVVHEMNRLEC